MHPSRGTYYPGICHRTLAFLVLDIYRNRIMQSVLFVLGSFLTAPYLRFSLVACGSNLFLAKSRNWFIHRPVDGHLGCSQFGATTSAPALDILVHVLFGWMHSFLLDRRRNGIARSRGGCIFVSVDPAKAFPKSGCTNFHSHKQCVEIFSCSTFLSTFGFVSHLS